MMGAAPDQAPAQVGSVTTADDPWAGSVHGYPPQILPVQLHVQPSPTFASGSPGQNPAATSSSALMNGAHGLVTAAAMPSYERVDLKKDISLRLLGLRLLPKVAYVRVLPKVTKGTLDHETQHLHPFVLKIPIGNRQITVGITDMEVDVNSQRVHKPKERKLRHQHLYVQGYPVLVPQVVDKVRTALKAFYADVIVPTPDASIRWGWEKGARTERLDHIAADENVNGFFLTAPAPPPPKPLPTTLPGPPPMKQVYTKYTCPKSGRHWYWDEEAGDFFWLHSAADYGWKLFVDQAGARWWWCDRKQIWFYE